MCVRQRRLDINLLSFFVSLYLHLWCTLSIAQLHAKMWDTFIICSLCCCFFCVVHNFVPEHTEDPKQNLFWALKKSKISIHFAHWFTEKDTRTIHSFRYSNTIFLLFSGLTVVVMVLLLLLKSLSLSIFHRFSIRTVAVFFNIIFLLACSHVRSFACSVITLMHRL